MIPNLQQSEEQKIKQQKLEEDFNNALENFENTQGEDLTYQVLLKSNPNLKAYFKKLIEKKYINEPDLIDLLLSKDQEFSEIKIDGKSILRCLIEDFTGHSSVAIIKNHIDKFPSIERDKDNNHDNLIASLLIGDENQDPCFNDCIIELIKILVSKGVKVDDENDQKLTSLDLCYNFEMFKALAEHSSPETLEKKLHYILEDEDLEQADLEQEDLEQEDLIEIINYLIKDKIVKINLNQIFNFNNDKNISFFYDIVKEEGNEDQKKICDKIDKCKEAIESFLSPESSREENIQRLDFVINFIPNELLKPQVLEKIITQYPDFLKKQNKDGLNLCFYAINQRKWDGLKSIIIHNPQALDWKNKDVLNSVFNIMHFDKLDLLKTIIETNPEILKQEDKNGLTLVFYAMRSYSDALKTIIETNPETLKQKDRNGLTPVFYAIHNRIFDALTTIIETNERVLDQKDQQGNNPIFYSLERYYNEPSCINKSTFEHIFFKQFGKYLQDEKIKNIVEFVGNYRFLKLFYDESGQGMYDKEFKSITSSILPSEEELESDLSKKLLKIYKTITEAKEEPSTIECHDANGDKTELRIYNSQLNRHASYFIFHVNAQNKLTKISYCDGNKVFSERKISAQIGRDQSPYIYGATTFELKELMDFIPQFAEDFVNKNSKGKTTKEFRLQHFSREKLESKEIFGCKFLGMTHSIPTKLQIRRNCQLKGFYVASRHLLEIQNQIEKSTTDRLFTYDKVLKVQGGEGYKSYKDLRQKMVDKAGEKLFESVKNFEKNFLDKIEFFEKMSSLMDRSLMKEKKAKLEKPTTKFLQTTPDFIDQINRNKFFNDNLVLDEVDHQKHFNLIATSHLNLSQEDVDKIKFLFEKKEVKIDDFLAWNFQTPQAKNNFIKLVFEHGDEGKKESFSAQLSASNPEKRGKFFEVLTQENLSLIITEFEKQKSKFGNLEQVIEGLKIKQREDPHGLEDFMSDADFFKHRDAKNNFVKEIESGSSEERKDAFIIKFCSDKSEENRNKFLNGLDPQCLGFMLRRSQAQLGKLKNVEKIIKELQEHVEKIDSKLINFEGVRAGDKRGREEEGVERVESVSSKKIQPSSSIHSVGGSSASSEKMVEFSRE